MSTSITTPITFPNATMAVAILSLTAYNDTYTEEDAQSTIVKTLEHATAHRHARTLLSQLVFCGIADQFPQSKDYHVTAMVSCLLGNSSDSSNRHHVAAMVLDKLNGNILDSTYTIKYLMGKEYDGNTRYMKAYNLARELSTVYADVALKDLRTVAQFLVA